MRIVAVLLACLAVAAAGCGGSTPPPAQQPVEFLEVLFGHLYRGEHGAAWASLYPAHQEVVPRGEYVACEEHAPPFAGTLQRVEVLTAKEEEWKVSGDDDPRESTAVTYRITVASPDGAAERVTGDGHILAVDGAWRWILKPSDFAAYSAGRCPVSAADA
jgi:hypothetical protein